MRLALATAALGLLCTQAHALKSGPLRRVPLDLVVIHSTGGPTCDAASGRAVWIPGGGLEDDLRSIESHPKLGIHYMIGRDGTVRASIAEDRIAYHIFTYSQRSIGIELVNDGDGKDAFSQRQLGALISLLRDIVHRRGIDRSAIKRHSDLDHTRLPCDRGRRRKVDPGAAFPFDQVLDAVFNR